VGYFKPEKNNVKIKIKTKINILDVIKSEKVPFFILFFSLIYIHSFHKMQDNDDLWFQQTTKCYSFLNYLHLRYIGWTGRMTSEAVFYFIFRDNGAVWKILNPLFIVLTAFAISKIVIGKKDDKKNFIINWYICIFWIFISKAVIVDSIMWTTGSIVYLWSTALALLAIIPFRDALMDEYNENYSKFLYIICAFLSSMGEEQVSCIIVVFATLINIHIYIKDKKIYKYLIIENILIVIGTIILFVAPGNYERNTKEIINWLPNYHLYSRWEFGFNGTQWLLNTLLNNSKIIFLLVLLALSVALYKKNRGLKNNLSIIIPIVGCILIISAIIFSIDTVLPSEIAQNLKFPHIYHRIWDILNKMFFDFSVPNPFAVKKLTIIKFIIWPIIIATVPYFMIYLYDFKINGIYVALMYIAGICSAMIMFVSPTIYASGPRTFFVLAIMFLIVFICLVKKSDILLKKRYLVIFTILAIFKYIFVFYF
jgi:hypothetical protein